SRTLAPPHVATASAAERAAVVLSPGRASIVHDAEAYRQTAPDGSVSTWQEETWRQTTRPYAQRELLTHQDGVAIETATMGEGPTELYDPAANIIYTNPPAGAPALATPMPASDGDPLVTELVDILRSGDAHAVRRYTIGGRAVISFAYDNPVPGHGVAHWTYVVDAGTYQPLRLSTTSPDGLRTTEQFLTYEALKPSAQTNALLSLRAVHPDATVDATRAGYQAAQARLSSPVAPGG
ncbi:MAG TPA: hypothetical protein VJU80_04710, partial [Solirubrobacteraceae bacterium]|nr:hypothetical protein [Solirubrobacteraceae bacterium]